VIAAASAMTIDAYIDRGYMNGSGLAISSGSTNGLGYGALARLGWAFQPAKPVTFIPFAEYDITNEHLAGYTETGGPFPATIGDMTNTVQTGRLGAQARYEVNGGSSIWSSFAWAHRFGDASPSISASLPSLFDVATPADASGRDWLEATAGIKVPVAPRTAINGSVTLSAFSSNVPTVQGDVSLSAGF
jgi:outer membrane autotransporter protein